MLGKNIAGEGRVTRSAGQTLEPHAGLRDLAPQSGKVRLHSRIRSNAAERWHLRLGTKSLSPLTFPSPAVGGGWGAVTPSWGARTTRPRVCAGS